MPIKAATQAKVSKVMLRIAAGCRKMAAAIRFKAIAVQIQGTSAKWPCSPK